MGLYVYCITPPDHSPQPGLRGIGEADVMAVTVDGVGAWASELASRPTPSAETIRRHDAVVRAAVVGEVTPLPVRFGEWFTAREPLQTRLEENRPTYAEALREVAGSLEFGLRILDRRLVEEPAEADAALASSGREYMESLVRRAERVRAAAADWEETLGMLRERLGGMIRREYVAPSTQPCILQVAHLVGRPHFDAYRRAVAAIGATSPRLQVHLTGPWPPYSFVP